MLKLSKFVVVVISAALIAIPIRANAASLNEESIATVTHEEVTCADISTCSWYGGEATFTFTHTTTPRYYDGTNVGIEMTCSSSKDGSFVVELWRGSSKLGDRTWEERSSRVRALQKRHGAMWAPAITFSSLRIMQGRR